MSQCFSPLYSGSAAVLNTKYPKFYLHGDSVWSLRVSSPLSICSYPSFSGHWPQERLLPFAVRSYSWIPVLQDIVVIERLNLDLNSVSIYSVDELLQM